MRQVVCPGSFDPVTNGDLDIIRRSSELYDEVVVAVLSAPAGHSLFSSGERAEMLRDVTKEHGNVRVAEFKGLLTDFCAARGITAIIKGLNAASDVEYETQLAQMNYWLARVETLFINVHPQYSFVTSSMVKEIAGHGGDVSAFAPGAVLDRLRHRLAAADAAG